MGNLHKARTSVFSSESCTCLCSWGYLHSDCYFLTKIKIWFFFMTRIIDILPQNVANIPITCFNPLSPSVIIQNLFIDIHTFVFFLGEFVKDDSNFYLVIMSSISLPSFDWLIDWLFYGLEMWSRLLLGLKGLIEMPLDGATSKELLESFALLHFLQPFLWGFEVKPWPHE